MKYIDVEEVHNHRFSGQNLSRDPGYGGHVVQPITGHCHDHLGDNLYDLIFVEDEGGKLGFGVGKCPAWIVFQEQCSSDIPGPGIMSYDPSPRTVQVNLYTPKSDPVYVI